MTDTCGNCFFKMDLSATHVWCNRYPCQILPGGQQYSKPYMAISERPVHGIGDAACGEHLGSQQSTDVSNDPLVNVVHDGPCELRECRTDAALGVQVFDDTELKRTVLPADPLKLPVRINDKLRIVGLQVAGLVSVEVNYLAR